MWIELAGKAEEDLLLVHPPEMQRLGLQRRILAEGGYFETGAGLKGGHEREQEWMEGFERALVVVVTSFDSECSCCGVLPTPLVVRSL